MLRRPVLPWIVLAASLLLTAVAAATLARSTRERDDEAFQNAVQDTRDRIRTRMGGYVTLLRGTAGLILSHQGEVSPGAFYRYAARLRTDRYYPGIRGIGYSRRLRSPAEAEALVQARRADDPDFRLWPDTSASERHAIVYLYAREAGTNALGYNMHSEPTRRAAMDRARDQGEASLSDRIALLQPQGPPWPGFFLYVPVFRNTGEPPPTTAARRAGLIGYAYGSFRAADVFAGIFAPDEQPRAAFSIYDGAATDSTNLLFDSRTAGIVPAVRPARTDTAALTVAGRRWTITYAATDTFDRTRDSFTPFVVMGGLALSLLLFGLSRAQVRNERLTLQSEQRFRVLLESIPVAVTVTDPEGRVTFRNARAAEMPETVALYEHETHVPAPPEVLPLARALRGERVEAQIFDVDAPGAPRRTVLASAFPVLAHDGALQMAVTAVVDVTDQKRAEERAAHLRRHAQELERSNRELQEFAYVASHDLQEPLRKIAAFAGLVRSDHSAGLGEEGVHYVQRIQDAATRMSQLIKDLLAFSRVSTQAQPIVAVDLGVLVGEVTNDLWARLQETGGIVEAHSLPVVYADPVQMRQLFQNLIANALKFHRPGVPPRVHLRGQRTRITAPDGLDGLDGWRLTVQDNGIGFDDRYAVRIFAPFQRLHTHGEYEGTGIGLAICRRIAERHGGSIRASSTPGEGTTFTIELPANPPVTA